MSLHRKKSDGFKEKFEEVTKQKKTYMKPEVEKHGKTSLVTIEQRLTEVINKLDLLIKKDEEVHKQIPQ
jgi:formiminotetrahydrofolate cyclodeaminase